MHWRKLCICCAAALFCMPFSAAESVLSVSAEQSAESESGDFASKFPDKFSADDTVIVTADSYKSHDVNIQMSRHFIGRLNGDVNESLNVDINDAVLLCKLLSEQSEYTFGADGILNADCNNDDLISAQDLMLLLDYLDGSLLSVDFFTNPTITYHVADIYIRDIRSLRGAFAKGTFPEKGSAQLESIKKMASDNNALFAINCDYCEIRANGITFRNGVMYRETKRAEVAVIYKNGVMDVLTDAEYRNLTEEEKAEIWQTTAFAPGLVKDGVQMTGFRGSTYVELHPRSGIGYYEPGHYCFVQVDGRQPGYSDGVSVEQFAEIMYGLGVQEAYNMDGGSSSEVVFLGQTYNHPSGIKTGSSGGRNNSDILYICNLDEIPEDTAAAAWYEKLAAESAASAEP